MSIRSFGRTGFGALALAGAIAAGFVLWGCGRSEIPAPAAPEVHPPAGHAQTNCPIMGGPVNKAIFADYQGKRVYFCCGGCPAAFEKDPAKYVKLLEAQGVVLDRTPQ